MDDVEEVSFSSSFCKVDGECAIAASSCAGVDATGGVNCLFECACMYIAAAREPKDFDDGRELLGFSVFVGVIFALLVNSSEIAEPVNKFDDEADSSVCGIIRFGDVTRSEFGGEGLTVLSFCDAMVSFGEGEVEGGINLLIKLSDWFFVVILFFFLLL